jgi:hypothetical protein
LRALFTRKELTLDHTERGGSQNERE